MNSATTAQASVHVVQNLEATRSMDIEVKRALLVVHTQIYFPRMLELGRWLKKSGRYEPIFYLAYKSTWPKADEAAREIERAALQLSAFCRIAPNRCNEPAKANWNARVKRVISSRRVLETLASVRNFVHDVRHNVRRIRFVKRILREEQIDVVVMSIDVATYDTPCFIRAAHDMDRPAVVAISCTRPFEEALEVYSAVPALSCSSWLNAAVGKLFPQWRAEYEGRRFLLIPGLHVLTRHVLGLAPPLPWVEGSSRADAVLAENDKFYREGIAAGLSTKSVVLTGQPVHDEMAAALDAAEQRREDVYAALGLPPGRPMILSSLIPDYNRGRQNVQFESHEALIRYWVDEMASLPGYNNVVTLHPSMNRDEFAWIERPGVKLASSTIAELMPLCHIFVTSVSSVMSYAIACGKPTINFNAFRYRNTMFAGERGIITIEDKDEFSRALHRLATDTEFFNKIAAHQAAAAPKWGCLDAAAVVRTIDVLDDVIARRRAPSGS